MSLPIRYYITLKQIYPPWAFFCENLYSFPIGTNPIIKLDI